MQQEVHISSLVVLIKPEHFTDAKQSIAGLPHLEAYADDPEHGKLVLVAETHSGKALLDIISEIEEFEGVINVAPVYHQVDNEQQLQQLVEAQSHAIN